MEVKKKEGKDSGIETLAKLVQTLDDLDINIDDQMKKIQPARPKIKQKSVSMDEGAVATLNSKCIFCGISLGRGSLFMTMTCCGGISHIQCFANPKYEQKCPICGESFDEEQLNHAKKLSVIIGKA